MRKTTVLVIIVTYNAMKWIDKCLLSLSNSAVKCDSYIVDNGSADGTQVYIKEHYPNVIFHQSKENLGFGRANNLGIRYAIENNYDYVYLLNQDAWVANDCFERLILASKANPTFGILSPSQLQADMETLDKNFSYNIRKNAVVSDIYDNLRNGDETGVVELDYIMAAHWMLTRECILKVGAFSPSFPHYGEDNNYCHRVLYHGLKIGVVPTAKAVHDRQYRVEPKDKKMYIGYISSIIGLSDITMPLINPKFNIIREQCASMVKHKSFIPIKYIFRLFKALKTIEENRKLSMNEGAFLSV